jgi:hypothetical protein
LMVCVVNAMMRYFNKSVFCCMTLRGKQDITFVYEEWRLLGYYAVWLLFLQEPHGVIPEDAILHSHLRENLKSYILLFMFRNNVIS